MKGAADDCLYEPEAVRVGLLLYPGRVCSLCGRTLPGNRDYFVPARHGNSAGLTSDCRQCRRARERERYGERRGS